MNKSDSIVKLSDALVKAQAEMPAAKMDGDNPFFHSKYATLGSVIDASKPILAKFGLAVVQPVINDGDRVGVETILIHSSGEWLSNICCIPLEASGKIAQIAGSIISYLRRYGLASILGMYSDEDTDGEHSPMVAAVKEQGGVVKTSKDISTEFWSYCKANQISVDEGKKLVSEAGNMEDALLLAKKRLNN